MPIGRPTKYTTACGDEVIQLMSQGKSKAYVAGRLGIARSTLYNWANAHPEFMDTIKRGETFSQAWWEDLGQAGTLGKIPGFNAAVWIFTMKNRFGWRDKVKNDAGKGAAIVVHRRKRRHDG